MTKTSDKDVACLAAGQAALAADMQSMAEELVIARTLIGLFESLLDGCSNQSFAGWENGEGQKVGDQIESVRSKLKAL